MQVIGANDRLIGAESYRSLILSYRSGAAIRLGDVATVIDDVEKSTAVPHGQAVGVRFC